jgi:hypothetical protein
LKRREEVGRSHSQEMEELNRDTKISQLKSGKGALRHQEEKGGGRKINVLITEQSWMLGNVVWSVVKETKALKRDFKINNIKAQ